MQSSTLYNLVSTVLSLCSAAYFVDSADIEKIAKTPSPTSKPVRSTDFEIVPNVFGGYTASEGDFPYFAQFDGCGGALIAPDIALTAAHCGDQTNRDIYIGAYKTRSTEYGAQQRKCATWIKHPNYSTAFGLINDVALCKLNDPVTIDESDVRLVLNREDVDAFPIIGEELVAMGFGLLGVGMQTPTFLQRTTLEGRECGFFSQPATQVCAGGAEGADGVTDVCRGDSGGPLVRVVPGPTGSPDVHYHVGLVSSGALCPAALTGTYARTSAMASWIDSAMCLLGSVGAAGCDDDDDEEVECEGDESTLEVNVVTDSYAYENQWILEKLNRRSRWVEVASDPLELGNFSYKRVLCLEPETSYKWTLKDTYGDGLCSFIGCGSYSVVLNGEEIVSDGPFTFEVSKEFQTPASSDDPVPDENCEDEPGKHPIQVAGQTKRKSCAYIERKIRKRGRRRGRQLCKLPLTDGRRVMDVCKETCAEVGLGECAE